MSKIQNTRLHTFSPSQSHYFVDPFIIIIIICKANERNDFGVSY